MTTAQRIFSRTSTTDDVMAGVDMTGSTAVLTGANAGIGYETLRAFVAAGAHVFALARTLDKARAACADLPGPGTASPLACDLEDFDSVVACAEAILATGSPIDVLVTNAGIYFLPELELVEGVEKHFAVNHLAHVILVDHLLPAVQAAPAGRIVIVGSDAHVSADRIAPDTIPVPVEYDPNRTYARSKLANLLHSLELSRRLEGTTATSVSISPMWVITDRMREYLRSLESHADITLGKTPSQGAATICYAATAPELDGVSGVYLEDCAIAEPAAPARDPELARRVWDLSRDLVRPWLRFPDAV